MGYGLGLIFYLFLLLYVVDAVGAPPTPRVAERRGYRHGSKPCQLVLRGGAVWIAAPRARCVGRGGEEREWRSRLLPRYRRATPEVEQAVLGVYLSGGNTRRIRTALEPLLAAAALRLMFGLFARGQIRLRRI